MMISAKLIGALSLCAFATFSSAQNVAGTWRGHVHAKFAPLATNLPATQRQRAQQMMEAYQRMVVVLQLKGDKTYTITMFGGPSNVNSHASNGSWTQSGRTLTLKPNPVHKIEQPELTASLSSDSATLNLTYSADTHVLFGRS